MLKPKSQLPPRTGADHEAALFATSCVLLCRWLNVAEARRLAKTEAEREKVLKTEVEVASKTKELLKIPVPDMPVSG